MNAHVAIVHKPIIDAILDGSKTVESRLTRTRRPPFEQIAPGDRIYFKASAGAYGATAIAGDVRFYQDMTPQRVDALREQYHTVVGDDDEYWTSKRTSRFATFITLEQVGPLSDDEAPSIPKSRGMAWFVLDPQTPTPAMHEVILTPAQIRNRYVKVPRADEFFEADAVAQSARDRGKTITLLLPDGGTIDTDIKSHGALRWRGWSQLFDKHAIQAGDRMRFTRVSPRTYRVRVINASGSADAPATTPATAGPPTLDDFITNADVDRLIELARQEDLGPHLIDVTTESFVPGGLTTTASFRSRTHGRLAGAALLPDIIEAYDPDVKLEVLMHDGDVLVKGDCVARVTGRLRSILQLERIALNFITHLSGIASLTARYVDAVEGTGARIYDTRKTIPGLRGLAKYAVACGGGYNHRIGLYDAMLVKDNHIAHLPDDQIDGALEDAIKRARKLDPPPAFIEVEVDTLAQLERVLARAVDIVLLDNMTPKLLREAVTMRDRLSPRVELEASGGITLDTVAAAARAGVDRISVGALTHSAPSLDLGLDIAT